jgi:hypothetical protein
MSKRILVNHSRYQRHHRRPTVIYITPMIHKHYYCNIKFRADSMNRTVGNLERKLAAYAEEQKEKKTRSHPTEKRYRDGHSKRAGSGGGSSNMVRQSRQKLQHMHYLLQLAITDMMLRSTDEQKELFKKTFPHLPYKEVGIEQAIMTLATSRTTTDHTLFLLLSYMEDNKLTRTFSFNAPPPPVHWTQRKGLN